MVRAAGVEPAISLLPKQVTAPHGSRPDMGAKSSYFTFVLRQGKVFLSREGDSSPNKSLAARERCKLSTMRHILCLVFDSVIYDVMQHSCSPLRHKPAFTFYLTPSN